MQMCGPLLYIHFSTIQDPRHYPCPTAHYHKLMVSFRGGEFPVSTQTEMTYRVMLYRHFVKMLPPQGSATVYLDPSPGMLGIPGSLDEAKLGNKHFLPSLTIIIIKLKKKMRLSPTLPT